VTLDDTSDTESDVAIKALDAPTIAFKKLLSEFPRAVFSWTEMYPHLMAHLVLLAMRSVRKTTRVGNTLREALKNEDEGAGTLAAFANFKSLGKSVMETKQILEKLPNVCLSALVTEYDLLIASLYRTLVEYKPEVLKSSKKAPTFEELLSETDMDGVRRLAVEHEIDEFGRKKRLEQIDKLAELTKLTPRNYLPELPAFVEVIERRHLFVHTNGVVNNEYLNNCKAVQAKIDGCQLGTVLKVDKNYLDHAARTIFIIGLVMVYLVWRKVTEKTGGGEADSELNEIAYQFIDNEKYDVAIRILRFGCRDIKSHSTDMVRRMMVINLCNALRLSGQKEEAIKELDKEDWSSSAIEFRLATQVISEDYSAAAKTMLQIGPENASVRRQAYHLWPLFRGFRITEDFKEAYKTIFGEAYVHRLPKEADNLDKMLEQYYSELKVAFEIGGAKEQKVSEKQIEASV